MKKILLVAFLLLLQNSFSKPINEAQKLVATCKVWGFLKYYHPNVANGSKNWDEQLFQILPKVEEAQTSEAFSIVIENWIDSLGEIKKQEALKSVVKKEYFDKNFDLSWVNNKELFSKSLSKKLKFIEENRIQEKQYYVAYEFGSNGPPLQFKNEVKYADFKWTDKNLRLLALFRYWNYIEYFFPYKYQMDQNWDKVLNEMLPRYYTPESEKDFNLAMREISVKLNDTHAATSMAQLFEYFGDKFIPVDVKIIDQKAVVIGLKNDSLAKINDLKIGDVITKVEGKTIAQLLKENSKYVEGSNEPSVLKNAYWTIFNGKTPTFEIEFIRDGKTTVKTINRYKYQDLKIQFPEQEKWKILEGNIGYVNFGGVNEEDLPNLIAALKNTNAIIFDDRKRPHDIIYSLADWLNTEPVEYVKYVDPDVNYPGRYIWRKEEEKIGKVSPDNYKGKVIVLIDENAVSHAEHTAMALQTVPKSTVIGSQTGGADGANAKFLIIKGFSSSFTCYGVFYPNKKEVQRIGIVPDIEVKPTILGIQRGKDEILDRAILFAKNGK
ncbi:C-terminal processing protease CtpA/Prc, contains a PDZ domain [Flavobacterium resistens]|uniref:C-terminal processing protease CtpA/Prc, contains a PDZ domain n=1 Tax=Flavobacterium resistens TaxID=443612 RepID=A0A521C947_9FLAO|nr:S41 family peptidase [Flavobacterium resistens]MRX66430.1 peptidase S41 [Flavobacterium resistens]SMO56017.1 C-terminal processing protease CtpA/Prc, contains a PDZ domain [Flavobacterium resistens]